MPAVSELVLDFLFIFCARVCDVSLSTVRFMIMVRGKRLAAAVLSFFEVGVWILALGRVMQSLDNPWKILAYCLGFATGVYVGQWVEERMAIGVAAVQVIPRNSDAAGTIGDALRERGFGVTVLPGEGRDGPRPVLLVIAERKVIPELLGTVRGFDPDAFVTVLEARATLGGTLRVRR